MASDMSFLSEGCCIFRCNLFFRESNGHLPSYLTIYLLGELYALGPFVQQQPCVPASVHELSLLWYVLLLMLYPMF